MAPEGCSATRCLARRARVVGALLASTASLAAAGPAKASRTQRKLTGYVMDDDGNSLRGCESAVGWRMRCPGCPAHARGLALRYFAPESEDP